MKIVLNLRKMRTQLAHTTAAYFLPITDVLEPQGEFPLNEWVGKDIHLAFDHAIHCVVTGKKIKKSYGDGFSYDAWISSPLACPSIIHPELSRIHEGIALRDKEWEEKFHNQPHYVYLSRTSDIKVGVTQTGQIPTRWIDQGASEAIVLAETPYRQIAGLIEVQLKQHFHDKTNWRNMLTCLPPKTAALQVVKEKAKPLLESDFQSYISTDNRITHIDYPVIAYPQKVTSIKLDTTDHLRGKLIGIKGQYLIFDGGRVFNVRSHSGYRVSIEG